MKMIEKAYFYKKTLEKLNSAELESKAPVYTEKKTHNIMDRYTVRLIKK